MENQYVNCHSHIFNIRCAPDSFLGFPITKRFERSPKLAAAVVTILKNLNPRRDDNLDKLSNFVKIGLLKSQKQVFENLRSNYSLNPMGYVVLTMDMDFMGAGEAILNFPTQLFQIRELKQIYKEEIIPFIGVDPRRCPGSELLRTVKTHIEDFGFNGIKLYPPLGYYPFDPSLKEIYAYAQDHLIPIITHCSKGGIHFQNMSITLEQIKPLDLKSQPANHIQIHPKDPVGVMDYTKDAYDLTRVLGKTFGKGKRNKAFKLHFANPKNYRLVLKEFPRLKICLAHFGGDGEIRRYIEGKTKGWGKVRQEDNWHHIVLELMRQHENVYADISYALWDKKAWPAIISAIQDPEIGRKVLFGTDYFMTIKEKSEMKLVNDFRKAISHQDFTKIAVTNPKDFLFIR